MEAMARPVEEHAAPVEFIDQAAFSQGFELRNQGGFLPGTPAHGIVAVFHRPIELLGGVGNVHVKEP
jgi:hypothetical protein